MGASLGGYGGGSVGRPRDLSCHLSAHVLSVENADGTIVHFAKITRRKDTSGQLCTRYASGTEEYAL